MSKPVVYGPAYSTYTRTARLALEEKGTDYDLVEVDFLQGMPKEQLERHPFGKVPAFAHDDFELYEAIAIARYVDEAFDGPALQPSDVRERARMTQIFSIVDSYVYACTIGTLVIQRLVTPLLGGEADEDAIDEVIPEVKKCMAVLDGLAQGHEYLAGDTLSLADLHLAPIYDYFSQTPESEAISEPLTALPGWWDRMRSRESMKKTAPQLG